jgi:hypothetical protein
LHASHPVRRRTAGWLLAILSSIVLLALLAPARGFADANPNNYQCLGHLSAGLPEDGSTDQQVQYSLACNGPITGYQLQSQIPLSGFDSAPLVTNLQGQPVTTDSFSCDGDFPGNAFNCVGATAKPFETITGQFTVATPLCAEPKTARVDPRLTVTYASVVKNVVTQAISGPYDLGRPHGCKAQATRRHHGGSKQAAKTHKHHSKKR